MRRKKAHCFEGQVGFALPLLEFLGYETRVVVIQADNELSVDHNILVHQEVDKIGSIAVSRDARLFGRPAIFDSIRALMLSYYSWYTADYPEDRLGDQAMIGYTDPIDMVGKYGLSWAFDSSSSALQQVYDTYTDRVWCTAIRTGDRYLYPPEE